jgi:cell division protein FtsQ
MWDSPLALNRLSDALFAGAALLVLYGLLRFAVHHPVFALGELRVVGSRHVTHEQVAAIVKRDLTGTFFTLDIERLRASFEKLPWVRRADVRRQWPDRIDVLIEEHQPLARWGAPQSGALVNRQGEVFHAGPGVLAGDLPHFSGPDGASVDVTARHAALTQAFAVIQRKPLEVHLTQRGAWRVALDNGMTLELGREQMEARLARFIAAYPHAIAPLKRRIDYVDLRYANGFAVRVPEIVNMKEAAPPRAGA